MSKERTQMAEYSSLPSVVAVAATTLTQGERLLDGLSPKAYTEPCPLAFDGTIGRHYRHCLDHFLIFVRDYATGEINFDVRERNVDLEVHPEVALECTRKVRYELESLSFEDLELPTAFLAGSGHDDRYKAASSTVGRELHYVTMHAIHHYALIAIIARSRGLPLDAEFGVAPSTLEYQRREAVVH